MAGASLNSNAGPADVRPHAGRQLLKVGGRVGVDKKHAAGAFGQSRFGAVVGAPLAGCAVFDTG